eukprot:TRINITY_DN4739_c0_g1_i1.p1 TRINITY_DN4739_c0_g1~~TRINITY_DN4739_c0_g1_i1.p1  ORF type:complete len:984 (+),score=385.13 TRINITY_DN4739_c0_g1_i1:107-2953(+)
MAAEKWLVKAVPSGDTLTLFQPDGKTFPPKEKTVVISGLVCPKAARQSKDAGAQPDDEFGWQAREFVRRRVIGRPVMFTKESVNEVSRREYGQVMFKETPDGQPKNLGAALVAAGLSNMRDGAKGPVAKELAEAEKQALMEKRGRWSDAARTEGMPRMLKWDPPQQEILDAIVKMKGQKFQAIVEHVISGHIYKVLLLDMMQLVVVNLSGIQCANERKTGPEELGVEARCHAERFLLHREVTLTIEGKDKYDNVLCTVTSGPNVFQEELLKQGYAKIFDPTISESTFRDRLRAAQAAAQQAKKGRWVNYIPPTVSDKVGKAGKEGEAVPLLADFTGIVHQVMSGDTVIVRKAGTGEKVRCGFASVRCGAEKLAEDGPSRLAKIERQMGGPDDRDKGGEGQKGDKDKGQKAAGEGLILYHNLFWEGREFLRKELVGKEVKVEVDYMMKLPTSDGQEIRPAVTVTYDGSKNAAEEVVKQGLGIVMGSKDGVSRHMDRLRDAQTEAQAAKLGGWSGKALPIHKVREMARPQAKTGMALLGSLRRAGAGAAGVPKLKCVIEFVLAPNRVKAYVERENCQVSVNMAGIATPSMGMGTEDPDPLAPEALEFAETRLLQREVEIQFEAFSNGSFIGNLFFEGKSFAVTLLGEGLATTEGQNTQSMTSRSQATEAEEKAKAEKKGIWAPTASLPKRALSQQARYASRDKAALTVTSGAKPEPVVVTEIIDSGHFFFQQRTPAAQGQLRTVEGILAKIPLGDKPAAQAVKRGEIVAARFSADKNWYRARVNQVVGDSKADVQFIDYGNKEVTPLRQIRQVAEIAESVQKIPALAQEAFVAFTQPVGVDQEFGNEAAFCLREYTQEPVSVRCEFSDARGNKYYSVLADGLPSAQEELLMRGLSFVRRDLEDIPDLKDCMTKLLAAQEKAKRAHTNMWRHGDPRDNDDGDDYRHVGRYN